METNRSSAVIVFSGGLDSTTLVYEAVARNQFFSIDLLSFNYGQRHLKELEYASDTADRLGLRHDVVDLSSVGALFAESGSSLMSETPVPEGHYAEDNMVKTIVPNRNMIMLSVAVGVAVSRNAKYVITGVHAGDHAVYPDCRPEFIGAVAYTASLANDQHVSIIAPFVEISKTDIAKKALELGLEFEYTWSCYKGGDIHCGKCGTCVERLEAIHEACGDSEDTTQYEDFEYWKTVTKEFKNS